MWFASHLKYIFFIGMIFTFSLHILFVFVNGILFWECSSNSLQWWRDLFRCRIDLLNFSTGFNIIAPLIYGVSTSELIYCWMTWVVFWVYQRIHLIGETFIRLPRNQETWNLLANSVMPYNIVRFNLAKQHIFVWHLCQLAGLVSHQTMTCCRDSFRSLHDIGTFVVNLPPILIQDCLGNMSNTINKRKYLNNFFCS